jgi:lysophospholipase L1-like esterase
MKQYTYLALGDAYTAGISVPSSETFPYQTVQLLRHRHPFFNSPEVIAARGWSTEELVQQIEKTRFLTAYDFVSLQIGVNNQTRGKDADEFAMQFESLLLHAIRLAGSRTERVIVLSIPDWSITPFGIGRSAAGNEPEGLISAQIDEYNKRKEALSSQYQVHFLDVTTDGRANSADGSLHSSDGLHPSAVTYQKWAGKLFGLFDDIIRGDRQLAES